MPKDYNERGAIALFALSNRKMPKVNLQRELARARKLGYDFSGHDPRKVQKITVPDMPKAVLAIGEVLGVMYRTRRDGKLINYLHKFRTLQSRPLLTVSPDGKQIVLIGGSYTFTDRGIEDVA